MIRPFFCSISSAVFLILSFPLFDFSFLIWIALVPLFIVVENHRPWPAFGWGYLTGGFFFSGTLYWFIHVTLPGVILLVLYLALYFGLFAGLAARFARSPARRLWFYPSLWVGLEYIRGHFLTGFGWISLAHTQYRLPLLMQMADVTGTAGLTFFIVMVNVWFKEVWLYLGKRPHTRARTILWPTGFFVILIFAVIVIYGQIRLSEKIFPSSVKIAAIQPNVPLDDRLSTELWSDILDHQLELSRQASAQAPDLIIWPETAFPGYSWEEGELLDRMKSFTLVTHRPLLFGIVTKEEEHYFNAAMLLAEGEEQLQHHKLHLVPFGEYIPFRDKLKFLENIVPIDDFTAGSNYTLFPVRGSQLGGQSVVLAVLICFEDTIPELSREFVRQGANILVNITNDAWFQKTAAPFQHLQASIFRAVENRRSLVRVANTGVSAFIDPYGRITRRVADARKQQIDVSGFAVEPVWANSTTTFYTKYGDIFTIFCFGCILWGIITGFCRKNQAHPSIRL